MDSSATGPQHSAVVSEEELHRLLTTRVSLKKAAELLGRSYQSTRHLMQKRHLITMQFGGVHKVTLHEVRRFLSRGNATERDWQEHSERTSE